MAKKAKVKPQPKLVGANTVKYEPNEQLSAMTGQIGPDLIGANLGSLSQQQDQVEQSKQVDNLRKKAKESLAKKKKAGFPVPPAKAQTQGPEAEVIPPGTFKNAEGELVVGDMKKFQASQPAPKKKVAKVKKK